MDLLVRDLQPFVDRPIENRSGVNGTWDVRLQFTPERGTGSQSNGPSLFTALREQLGLKLTSARVPVDVLVVDSISRPGPD